MLKQFVIYMLLFLTGMSVYAQQGVITGTVVDRNGVSIEGAVVKLTGRETYTETDAQGIFKIEAETGAEAVISQISFKNTTVNLTDGIQIILKDDAIDLDNIVIIADPFNEIAQSRIITDDIKSTSQPRNVSDLFRDIPGFGIQKRGAYASEPVFRAFKYEQLNVMYDGGMKIVNACPNRMDPITTHIIPEEVESIEIIRGPFSMRFGQSFGGIINMVTKSGNNRKNGVSGNLETGFESNGSNFTGRGTVFYKADKFDLELNGSYRNYGDYTDGNGTEVPSSFKTTDYSIKAGFNPSEDQRLRLTWRQSFGRDIKHAGLMMDSPYDDSYLAGLDYRINGISSVLSAITFKGFYSYVDHLMTNEDRPSFKMTGASSNVFATNYGGKVEFELTPSEKFKIYTGIDGNFIGREGNRIRTIKIMNGMPLPEPKVKVDKIWQDSQLNDFGIFAEGKYLFNSNSVLTAGLRTDLITASINDPEADFLELYGGEIADRHETNFSGTVSYIYKVSRSEWQFAFGRGVRTAAMIERFINHFNIGSDPYEYVGNPYLDPEVNNQFEISFGQRYEKINFGASVFYSFLNNYITAIVDESLPRKYMPTVPPVYAKRFINIDNAVQTGFEAHFNYQIINSLQLLTDVSYTYGQNKDFDEPLSQIAPLTGHVSLHFDKEIYWINLRSRLVAEQGRIAPSFKEEVTPGFATFDLSAGVKPLKGLSIGGAVLNIFDAAYYEHLNFSYKNSSLLSGRIYEPGRNFTIYVNYTF